MSRTVNQVTMLDKRGHWTRVLRRQLAGAVEVNAHDDLASSLADRSTIYVMVVDASEAATAIEQTLDLCSRQRPPYVLAIVPPLDRLMFRMRCAGATAVWRHDQWPVEQIGRLIRRICRQAPAPTLSLEERIWKNLPWSP